MNECEFRNVGDHIEVYLNGKFIFSADDMLEAIMEAEDFGIIL